MMYNILSIPSGLLNPSHALSLSLNSGVIIQEVHVIV